MIDYDELYAESERIRTKRKALKDEEAQLAEKARMIQHTLKRHEMSLAEGKQSDECKKLREENQRLMGMLAVLYRNTNATTYRAIGEHLGVSGCRARQVVDKQLKRLRTIKSQMETEERRKAGGFA